MTLYLLETRYLFWGSVKNWYYVPLILGSPGKYGEEWYPSPWSSHPSCQERRGHNQKQTRKCSSQPLKQKPAAQEKHTASSQKMDEYIDNMVAGQLQSVKMLIQDKGKIADRPDPRIFPQSFQIRQIFGSRVFRY